MSFNTLVQYVAVAFHKPYDVKTVDGRAKERVRRIALTALAAATSKVFSTIIPFITIRWSLQYLGVEIYGLWNAVTSFFALFAFADLGLGNGLQTLLSNAYGKGDIKLQQKVVYNSYVILSIVSLFLIILFFIVYPFVDWGHLMNAESADAKLLVGGVIVAIVVPRLISVPLSLIQRIQLAYQEGYNSHCWQCVASLLSLVSIYIIYKLNIGKLNLIWCSALIPVVIYGLNSLFYYNRKTCCLKFVHNLYDRAIIRLLINTGIAFFILSILTTLGLAIDTFIVARISSLNEATPFSILHKIACFISIICGMISTPMWAANGEAMARGEYDWVRRNTIRISLISIMFAVIASVFLLLVSGWWFPIWLGSDFQFSYSCLLGMCVTQIILSGISPFFMILNAANVVKKQILLFSLFTAITLVLKFNLAPKYGIDSIPWISNVCYVLCIVPFVIHWSWNIVQQK